MHSRPLFGCHRGRRNFEVLPTILDEQSLPIQAEQIGGMVSRSMYLSLATAEVKLKISGQAEDFVSCKN